MKFLVPNYSCLIYIYIYSAIVNPSYSDPRFSVLPNSVTTAIHRSKAARPKTGREELGSAY